MSSYTADFLTRDAAVLMLTQAARDASAERMDAEALALNDAAKLVRFESAHLPIHGLVGTHRSTGLEVTLLVSLRIHVFAGKGFHWTSAIGSDAT